MNRRLSLLAACGVSTLASHAGAASSQDEFAAALAAAPPGIRQMQCRDVALLSGADLADFHKWFDPFMAPVARSGIGTDEVFRSCFGECAQDQNWPAVDAALRLRSAMLGLTPQHVGGK
jgi:hypothetical protein